MAGTGVADVTCMSSAYCAGSPWASLLDIILGPGNHDMFRHSGLDGDLNNKLGVSRHCDCDPQLHHLRAQDLPDRRLTVYSTFLNQAAQRRVSPDTAGP